MLLHYAEGDGFPIGQAPISMLALTAPTVRALTESACDRYFPLSKAESNEHKITVFPSSLRNNMDH